MIQYLRDEELTSCDTLSCVLARILPRDDCTSFPLFFHGVLVIDHFSVGIVV